METICSQEGFRIQLKVPHHDELIKCFIFLNFKKMKIIRDIEEHIKSLLDLKTVSLYVEGAWLPSNETVCVIKEDDIVEVKPDVENVIAKTIQKTSDEVKDYAIRKRKKKKVDIENNTNQNNNIFNKSIAVLYQELYNKKNELLVSADTNIDEASQPDYPLPMAKKKRIRKHKKKSKNEDVKIVESALINNCALPKELNVPFNGKHTRFSEDTNNSYKSSELGPNDNVLEIGNSSELINSAECKFIEPLNENEPVNIQELSMAVIQNKDLPSKMDANNQAHINEVKGITVNIDEIPIHNENNLSTKDTKDSVDMIDWKTKLLSLAKNDLESKVFHRKNATEELVQAL